MAKTLQDTITIKFVGEGTGLEKTINDLDRATKALISTQQKIQDDNKKGTKTVKVLTDANRKLYLELKSKGIKGFKELGLASGVLTRALQGNKVALRKVRTAMLATTTSTKKLRKGILSTTHDTRILGGAFSVLRSKLLLVSFAMALVMNTIGKLVKGQAIQELAEKKLSTALGRTSQALLKQASALQEITAFGDESIISVQASIAAFTDSEAQIKKATVATLDIASAMGMDLKSAGDLVAKTLGSSTNAMSRYGVEVVGAVGSTERLESLTKNVARLFGGQAKSQAETMSGALDQAGNSAGDLAEKIGDKLSPLIIAMAKDFKTTAENLSELISPTIISDQETLNELARERNLLSKSFNETLSNEADFIDDLFGGWEEYGEVSKEAIDSGTAALDEQIEKFNDLLYAKKEVLKLTFDVKTADLDYYDSVKKVQVPSLERNAILTKLKKEQIQQDIRGAALSGQSATQAMKSVVKAETMEAVAGYLASVLKTVPFPANLMLAAAGGGVVAGLMDKALGSVSSPKFEQGGLIGGKRHSQGGTMIEAEQGEFIMSRSAVSSIGASTLNQMNQGGGGGITLNISAPLVDEHILDTIIPAIQKAQRMNLA